MNFYAYVGNDPINKLDPNGHNPMLCGFIAAGAVFGGIQGGILSKKEGWGWIGDIANGAFWGGVTGFIGGVGFMTGSPAIAIGSEIGGILGNIGTGIGIGGPRNISDFLNGVKNQNGQSGENDNGQVSK